MSRAEPMREARISRTYRSQRASRAIRRVALISSRHAGKHEARDVLRAFVEPIRHAIRERERRPHEIEERRVLEVPLRVLPCRGFHSLLPFRSVSAPVVHGDRLAESNPLVKGFFEEFRKILKKVCKGNKENVLTELARTLPCTVTPERARRAPPNRPRLDAESPRGTLVPTYQDDIQSNAPAPRSEDDAKPRRGEAAKASKRTISEAQGPIDGTER